MMSEWTDTRLLCVYAVSSAVLTYWILKLYNYQSSSARRVPFVSLGRIQKLVIYPIKSCKGIYLTEATCTAEGLESGNLRDRQFLVMDAEKNEFVTARSQPTLVLVTPTVTSSGLSVTAPGMSSPLEIQYDSLDTKPTVKTTLFRNEVEGVDCGSHASQWFSEYLKADVKLLYFHPKFCHRPLEALNQKSHTRRKRKIPNNGVTMYSDGFPFLLCNEASVTELNRHLAEPVTYRNFRPNILVEGTTAPYVEDNWRELEIGEVVLFGEKYCGRCRLPNVNPDTGIPHRKAEPLNTLFKTRLLREYSTKDPMFGMNLVLDSDAGQIRVGDAIMGAP